MQSMKQYAIAIHGGAGTLVKGTMTEAQEAMYKAALQKALMAGYTFLEKGGSALDAVEAAVKQLEDAPLFNAGKGAVFTAEGTHEMDAAIMEGEHRKAGAVSLVSGIRNPIALARDVMEKSNHVFLAGAGAMAFARSLQYPLEDEAYFYNELRYRQWQEIRETDQFQLDHTSSKDRKFGTVGAVACDALGNLAAATSTGGMTNKKWGRVGDSPLIGAGTYASNATCAVSCTGSGEYFIRGVAAYDVACLIEYKGYSLEAAASEVIHRRMVALGGDGGLIAIDNKGNIAMPFNTEGMYRARRNAAGENEISIYG